MKTIRLLIIIAITALLNPLAAIAQTDQPPPPPQWAPELSWMPALYKGGWDHTLYLSQQKKVVFFYHREKFTDNAAKENSKKVVVALLTVAKKYKFNELRFYRVDVDTENGAAIWGYMSQGTAVQDTPQFVTVDPGPIGPNGERDPLKAVTTVVQMDDTYFTEGDITSFIHQMLHIPSPIASTTSVTNPLAGK